MKKFNRKRFEECSKKWRTQFILFIVIFIFYSKYCDLRWYDFIFYFRYLLSHSFHCILHFCFNISVSTLFSPVLLEKKHFYTVLLSSSSSSPLPCYSLFYCATQQTLFYYFLATLLFFLSLDNFCTKIISYDFTKKDDEDWSRDNSSKIKRLHWRIMILCLF